MRILGLDLGTVHPARATLDVSGRKPVLVGSSRGSFGKVDPKTRPETAFEWLRLELAVAWASDIRVVVVEDPTRTLQGVMRDKQTNAHSLQWLMAQFHRVSERARAMGFTVVAVEPRTVSARIGIKLTPKASVTQRRREKKAQTKRWVELCVVGGTGLTEDEYDAVAIAYAGRPLR